ncbi:MAG: NADH-quinone oxidoreductase subunit I [Ignavibacteriae bacterium]|nr:NADH-quinone oxidoreductase subunit I [Ignavibacteriota bacterium]MCB9215597.1 NADH-quinone oxidoreductase subunit I [Ignavibacteria bacterium]
MATQTVSERTAKRMTFWEKLYLPEIAKGMTLTFKQMLKPSLTRQYPEEKFHPEASYRGRPVLVQEEYGERCVACGLCSRVCPAIAIEVQAGETSKEKERYPEKFEINMLRCIFCGYCEEACPEEAIVMSRDYELVFENVDDAIFGKDRLLVPVAQLQERLEYLRQYKG